MAMAAPQRRLGELEPHLAAQAMPSHRTSPRSFISTPGGQHIIDQGFDLVPLDPDIAQRARVEAPELLDGRAPPPRLGGQPAQPLAEAHPAGFSGAGRAPFKHWIHCSSFTIE